jgi:hypothetical protein
MAFVASDYGTVRYWAEFTNTAKCLNASSSAAADTEAIATINDSGPNGYSLAQSNNSYRPACRTNQVNGLQAARFDAGDGYSLSVAQASGITRNKSGITIALVAKTASLAASQRLMRISGNGAFDRVYIALLTGGNWNINVRPQDGGTEKQLYTSASYSAGTSAFRVHLIRLDFSGNACHVWLDTQQTLANTNINSSGNSSDTDSSGAEAWHSLFSNTYGSAGWNGDVTDFIVWDGALSDSTCSSVITALTNKLTTSGVTGAIAQVAAPAVQGATGAGPVTGTSVEVIAKARQAGFGTTSTATNKEKWWALMAEWSSYRNDYIVRNGLAGDAALANCYYDAALCELNLATHFSDTATFHPRATNCYQVYGISYGRANNWQLPGFWSFGGGLAERYTRFSDAGALSDLQSLCLNAAYHSNSSASYNHLSTTPSLRHELSREWSYVVKNMLYLKGLASLTADQQARLDSCFLDLLTIISDWTTGVASYYRPFMGGLAAHALTMFYEREATAGEKATIQAALEALATFTWTSCWDEAGQSMRYTDRDLGGASDLTPSPDLSMLIAPMYSWLWSITGNSDWKTNGRLLFEGAIPVYNEYGNSIGGAYLGSRSSTNPSGKQFDQQLVWAKYFDYDEVTPAVSVSGTSVQTASPASQGATGTVTPVVIPTGGGWGGGGGSSSSYRIPKRNIRTYGVTPKVQRPMARLLSKRKLPNTYKGIVNWQEEHPELAWIGGTNEFFRRLVSLPMDALVSRVSYLAARPAGPNLPYEDKFNSLLMEIAARGAKKRAVRKADEDIMAFILSKHS